MARTTETPAEGMRRCIGSAKFGLPAHDAPITDFPSQPSQKDGLGRMCRQHWTQYTRALRTGSILAKPVAAPASVVERGRARADKFTAKVTPAPKPRAKGRARRGGPIGSIGSAEDGPVEMLAGGEIIPAAPLGSSTIEPDGSTTTEDAILVARKARVKAHRATANQATTSGELYRAAKTEGRVG